MYLNFPNFVIQNKGKISSLFLELKIYDFHSALCFVHNLLYGRNSDRSDYSLIFKENKGTCSTKHAALAALAIENGHPEIKLCTAVCKFDASDDLKISKFLLEPLEVSFFPEMHCFLTFKNEFLDITFRDHDPKRKPKIIQSFEINPCDIDQKKLNLHKKYIIIWMNENKINEKFSFEQIWFMREKWILSLS